MERRSFLARAFGCMVAAPAVAGIIARGAPAKASLSPIPLPVQPWMGTTVAVFRGSYADNLTGWQARQVFMEVDRIRRADIAWQNAISDEAMLHKVRMQDYTT